MKAILVVDSQGQPPPVLGEATTGDEYELLSVTDTDAAVGQLRQRPIAAVIFIQRSEREDWQPLHVQVRARSRETGFVLATEEHRLDLAIAGLRARVSDYLALGATNADRVRQALDRAVGSAEAEQGVGDLLGDLCQMVDDFLDHMVALEGEIRELRRQLAGDTGEGEGSSVPLVLVVDPDDEQASALTSILESSRCTVQRTASVDDAVSRAEEQNFRLCIVESRVGETDGIDVIQKLRKVRPQAEQMIVVDFTSADDAVEALRVGAGGFLLKPYHEAAVKSSLREILMRQEARVRSQAYLDTFRNRYRELLDRRRALDGS